MKRLGTAGERDGFTLVELLVAIAIGGVLLTATYELLNTNSKLYYSKENTMIMTQDLRAAAGFLVRELRMAGCNPTGAGGIGFQNDTSATLIHFTMDLDGDGATTGTNEEIEYYIYSQNQIQSLGRKTGGAVGLVAEYITSLTFNYYDSTGAEFTSFPLSTANLGNIYAVNISITAETPETDAITHVKKTDNMTTRVSIRNAGLQ